MKGDKPAFKMPEIFVFIKFFIFGVVGTEIFRVSFYMGSSFAPNISGEPVVMKAIGIAALLILCLFYAYKREAFSIAKKMGLSLRFDLMAAFGAGVWVNEIASSRLSTVHGFIKNMDPSWAPALTILLCSVLCSPLFQHFRLRSKNAILQRYFIADEEIAEKEEDVLASDEHAKSFADAVLVSGSHPGLIFGVDGPWGVGKTSFINLVQNHWEASEERAIVCRFEPLRYASESDLSGRLVRELSAVIQQEVFAPEFRPVASRYSRLIKGKADISFLGFKLSLEQPKETVEELLDDIDEVLRRIGRHVIIVIDDLDRLDPVTANNVLFATRQTFRLSQATYVLCYDTEALVGGQEAIMAREFLEKFVTVKLSLFVDSSRIRDFLKRDWQNAENQLSSVPADTMIKLSSVIEELANILDGELAAYYLPLIGDLRKIKRFINAMLIMQIEKSPLGRTDFNKRDLINLILLHLNYPGIFRYIYAEEAEGRYGLFSLHGDGANDEFYNKSEFHDFLEEQQKSARFLLKQIFDFKTLELGGVSELDEATMTSRACFNHPPFRNLEAYLKLIVRFVTPEPQSTFTLYQKAVEGVKNGASITSTLMSDDFSLEQGEHAHDQFWRILVNQSHDLRFDIVDDAINVLVLYLGDYSAIENDDRGLRQRSIYSLLRLLNRAGWGRSAPMRTHNKPEYIVEIAHRIFGEESYQGQSLLEALSSEERGVLGWNDLMLFRLHCSADRQAQLHNLYSSLIVHQNMSAPTTGHVSDLAIVGMRKLSQRVFEIFKERYIDGQRNFFREVTYAPGQHFLSKAQNSPDEVSIDDIDSNPVLQRIMVTRNVVKIFVIYQLSNTSPPNGTGVGCGYYDISGDADGAGIAKAMNRYVFDFCFNPDIQEENIYYFLDHCLSNLGRPFFMEDMPAANKTELTGGLDGVAMGLYWKRHGAFIREQVSPVAMGRVFTPNYVAEYSDHLEGVFAVLDELTKDAS